MRSRLQVCCNWLVVLATTVVFVTAMCASQAQTVVTWRDGFELGWGDWYEEGAGGGAWGIGSPASGPPLNALGARAYAGTNCAGTGLSATPVPYVDTRLVSPPIPVPAATQHPRLRFWHWFSFGDSMGQVEISVNGGTWAAVSPEYSRSSSGHWTRPWIDLVPYAAKSIRLAFHYYSEDTPGRGWFVDEVTVETSLLAPVLANPEGFELGWGDWYEEGAGGAAWGVGSPASGPPPNAQGARAYAGTNCAATGLSATPAGYVDTRLVSPPFVVPVASQHPRLRFWHWFSFGDSMGQVEISVNGGSWATVSPEYSGSSGGGWTRPWIDLVPYAGKSIRLASHYYSEDAPGRGWFVDEVTVETSSVAPVLANPEGFELGWGDWFEEGAGGAAWGVGSPASGPALNAQGARAYAGTNCAATGLSATPAAYVDTRFVSPPFVVPVASQHPRLRFWHWFSFGDSMGQVEISVNGGSWATVSPEYSRSSSGNWSRPWIDLVPFAAKSIRLAFHYYSEDAPGRGWFVDEVTVETSSVAPVLANPEGFELGWGDWFEEGAGGAAWGVGSPASGPPLNAQGARAYAGTNCAATGLSATPAGYVDTRLVGPPFVVPVASQNPRLRFWHWFSFGDSMGQVEISVNGGSWASIPNASYSGSSGGGWTRPRIDLVPYAAKSIRLAFHYYSEDAPGRGWFVDEVYVETDGCVSILTPPASQTNKVGASVIFTVFATGSSSPAFQWRFNGNTLTNSARINGATNSALLIANLQESDAGDYVVEVSDASCSATSAPAHLTVLAPPYIITPPTNEWAMTGSHVTFHVLAGGTLPLAYQWCLYGTNLANNARVSGVNTDTLSIANVQIADAGPYTVVVSSDVGAATNSTPAFLSVVTLPFPWTNQDIGDAGIPGSASYTNGVFTVRGSGEDIEGTADAFQFVFQPLTGDGQIVAHILSLEGEDPGTEAGIMLRENLDSGSKHVFLTLRTNELIFRRRLGATNDSVQTSISWTNSCWLRLMRMGNTIVGHYSTNNLDWQYVWFTTVNMSNQVLAGPAVTAHDNGRLATATFTDVSVGGLTPLTGVRPGPGPIIYLGGEPLTLAGLQALGGFKMLLAGTVGDRLFIKSTSDFVTWTDLGSVTNTYGVVDFLDTQALTNSFRFYRAQRIGP